jgi:hypothetical protein
MEVCGPPRKRSQDPTSLEYSLLWALRIGKREKYTTGLSALVPQQETLRLVAISEKVGPNTVNSPMPRPVN